MSSRTDTAPATPKRGKRILSWLGRRVRRFACALVARRVVVNVLLAGIAVELVVLGVGLSRRLELANEQAMAVSEAQLAVIEARTFSEEHQNRGSAGISANGNAPAAPENGADEAPPLRPRDVDTILLQETGTTITITREDEAPAQNTAAGAEQPDPLAGLNADDREEVDRLLQKAVSALTAGDIRLCILSLEEAGILAPEHPALLYYYGVAYDKLCNPHKARDYYTRVFAMRDRAGVYFQRASSRLTFGFEQPGALRGKLSFGPHQTTHTYDAEKGERVEMLLPVILAPGENVRPDDIYIAIQFFDLVNGRKIEFSRLSTPELSWQNENPTWKDWEEHLMVSYAVPPLTQEEMDAYGDLKYYGFTAKLYYKGEPLDCISSPSALILQEQRLNSRRRGSNKPQSTDQNSLFPDDGLLPMEEAAPVSDFTNELIPATSE